MITNRANNSPSFKDAHNIIKKKTPIAPRQNLRSINSHSSCSKQNSATITQVPTGKSKKLPYKTPDPASFKRSIPIWEVKSLSLVELPVDDPSRPKALTFIKPTHKEFGYESKLPRSTGGMKHNIPAFRSFGESALAKKVLLRFTTHAWRNQRAQVKALQTLNRELKNQVENFNLQTLVLKDLLAFEKERVQTKSNESALLKVELKKELETKEKLKIDLKECEVEKTRLEITTLQMRNEYELLKGKFNEVDKLNEIARQLIDVYHKDKDNFKDKESQLVNELKTTEDSLEDSRSELINMENKCNEYQIKIIKLSELNRELLGQNECKQNQLNNFVNVLKQCETELGVVKTVCREQNSCIEILTKDLKDAHSQINEKTRRIEQTEEVIKRYETEKEALNNKLKHLALDAFGYTLKFIPASNLLPF